MSKVKTCIYLSERFGDVYRIGHDDAAGSRDAPWMMTMPCRRGVIYPHGGDLLAVDVDGRPMTAKRVGALPGVMLHQDGDSEMTLLFPVDLFDAVAEIVLPRRRRRLSEERRAQLIAAGARFQFRHGARSFGAMRQDAQGALDDRMLGT
jgi:hypothetical protein